MQYVGIQTQQSRNNFRSLLLLCLFPCLVMGLLFAFCYLLHLLAMNDDGLTGAELLGYSTGMFIHLAPYVLGGVLIWFIIAYFANTSIINSATGSEPLSRMENKRVYNLVENLCMSQGMKMPKINIINDDSLNAFASGINERTYTVSLSRGIIDKLNDQELEAVIAHELSHIRNKDVRLMIVSIVFVGIFAMIAAGPIWGSICGKKYMIEVPEHVAQQADIDESKLPKFGTIVGIIMIPLLLIIANSVAKVVPALAGIQPVLAFLGEPFMALLLATIAAMYLLGTRHGYTNAQLEKIMTKSLEPTGMILLVTACGGVLRYMLQNSGLGDVIGNAVANASLPLVLVAFIVAALVRISVGSSTVAMTMAAGIISAMPGLSALSPLYLACVTAAIAGGSTVCSHFNDSGFWLVKSLVGMDEKTTLKTWTIMETLVGGVGFLVALIISFFA
mgnify:CR=1 FL=1